MTSARRLGLLLVLIGVIVRADRPYAQQPADDVSKATFEVASVKPNNSGVQGSRVGMAPNGRFQATNVTLGSMIQNAYNIRPFQLTGGPSWINSDRFDIMATVGHEIKPTPGGPPAEIIAMVKNLLADRFKLAAHIETKEMPIYYLVLARPDGKFGPKLRPAEIDCAALMARGGPPPTPSSGEMPPCSMRINNGVMSARGGTAVQIARTLSGTVERLVVDKTGLAGGLDLDLEWSPDPNGATAGPSIFTALQEQLGLKLEAARGPMEILVIDHAELPAPD